MNKTRCILNGCKYLIQYIIFGNILALYGGNTFNSIAFTNVFLVHCNQKVLASQYSDLTKAIYSV